MSYLVGQTSDPGYTSTCDNPSIFNANADECDVYIKIFINGELALHIKGKTNRSVDSLVFYYESPKISKISIIRFEMWDDDSGFLGSNDNLMLDKSVGVVELAKPFRIYAGYRVIQDNQIWMQSKWKDEFQSY